MSVLQKDRFLHLDLKLLKFDIKIFIILIIESNDIYFLLLKYELTEFLFDYEITQN